jgi:4-amino-4-deoxy-L-arabinose transferase-like glycosyltransferase
MILSRRVALSERMFPTFLTFLHRCSPLTLSLLLFVLAFFTFSWRMEEGPIYRTMEGREALVMQEIANSGNWILPLRNGETIPSKPPLLHWTGVVVAYITGSVSEWSVRFPCALFSALTVAFTCLLGCRLSGREVGVLAALMLLTTPMVVEMGREAWVDPALSFFVVAALASFSSMYENEAWRGWRSWVFYLALAGATLSKGPIGYILPLLVIVVYLAVQQQLSRLRNFFFLPGVLVAIGLPLTWYLLALQQEGWAFIHKQVLQENLLRFTAGSGKRIPSTAFFFGPFVMSGLPWSVLFGFALWRFARHAPVREKGVFPLLWWFSMLMFFSISAGKRDVYLLPAYPAMALFTAEWGWAQVSEHAQPLPRVLRLSARIAALSVATVILCCAILAALGYVTIEDVWLDRLFGQEKWSGVALYLRFVTEHPLYGTAALSVLCAGSVWSVLHGTAGRWRSALWSLLGVLFVSSFAVYPFTRAYTKEYKSFTGFAAAITQVVPPNQSLRFYTPEPYSSEFDEFSQVYFYLNRHVPLAICAEQPDFALCAPGYYVLRFRHWQKLQPLPTAALVLDSADSAGPNPETRLVLVRRIP